jgi:Ca2+-binding RTX toxin-like protein
MTPPSLPRHLLALAAATAAFLAFGPLGAAHASAGGSVAGTTAVIAADGADDTIVVSESGGRLIHSPLGGHFHSARDFDDSLAGDQSLAANEAIVAIDGGAGDDTLAVTTPAPVAVTLDGGPGRDTVDGRTDASATAPLFLLGAPAAVLEPLR